MALPRFNLQVEFDDVADQYKGTLQRCDAPQARPLVVYHDNPRECLRLLQHTMRELARSDAEIAPERKEPWPQQQH